MLFLTIFFIHIAPAKRHINFETVVMPLYLAYFHITRNKTQYLVLLNLVMVYSIR